MRTLLAATLLLTACNSSHAAPTAATAAATGAAEAQPLADGKTKVAIRVTKEGFEPKEVKVPQGKPVILEFTRETESECLNAILLPWLSEKVALPMNKPVAIPFDATKVGTIAYSCWMNMVFGKITVTPS